MVYTKGSRFGVFSGHTVRRPEFTYSQLCADQHIIIQSNASYKSGSPINNDVHLSMNKRNRWQMTDDLIDELSAPNCTVIVSRHHLKQSQYRKFKVVNCLNVCSQKNGERHHKSANGTYARAADLAAMTDDKFMENDGNLDEMSAKRGKGRKGYKKRQKQDEDGEWEEEVLIQCKVYTAPSKHRFQIQLSRGSYSGKSSKMRKGLPRGNVSYYQEMYEDEVWDDEEDFMLKEAMENSLDAMRGSTEGDYYTGYNNSLEDFIQTGNDHGQRDNKGTKRVARHLSFEGAKDRIFYVDREEYAVPSSWQSASYVPKPRGWKKEQNRGKKRKGQKLADESIEEPSTLVGDRPSFLVAVGQDHAIEDLKVAASKNFDCCSFLWSKCLPPRLVINVTSYIHGKLREAGHISTVRAMAQLKKECWILVERNDMGSSCDTTGPRHAATVPHYSTKDGIQAIRFTLIRFPRDTKTESETRDHFNNLHLSGMDEVMKILKEHIDKLPLEGFFTSASCPSGKPEIKLDVLSAVWNSKPDTTTPLQLFNQLEVEDSCHGNSFPEEHFLQPLSDYISDCEICLESDLTGPDGIAVYATALTYCQHWFCNNCWRNYLGTAISRGETRLACPAYDCKSRVDEITLVSFVPASSYRQYKDQQLEALWVSQGLVPCPKEGCGHLLPRLPEGAVQRRTGLICACGGVWCNSCRDKLHWPSTCKQNEQYKEKFRNKVGILKVGKIKHVNVKRCPACSYPVEKSGGCMHMVCRCSHSFCWHCGNESRDHNYNCREEKALFTIQVELRDVIILKSNYDRAVFHRSRGRRSAIKARQTQADRLLSRLLTALRGSATLEPCPEFHSQRVKGHTVVLPSTGAIGSHTVVLPSTGAIGSLSHVLQDAQNFCSEVEFVLEHLEIYLTTRKILNHNKRQLVTEMKDRLAFLSNQIHQILEQKTSFDVLTVSKRLRNLTTSGSQNLHRLAVTLK